MPSPKARTEAFVPLPLPPGSGIPPPAPAASAAAHAARQARRWGLTDTSAVPADSPAFTGAPASGSALGVDEDEDVVFSRSSPPPAGPARTGATAGGFSSRFSSAYATGASPAGSPGLSARPAGPAYSPAFPPAAATASASAGGAGRTGGTGEAGPLAMATGHLHTSHPHGTGPAVSSSSTRAAGADGGGGGSDVLVVGAGRRLPADTLTLLSGLDFDSGDSAAAAEAASDSDSARVRALHALLAMGDLGCLHAIPSSLRVPAATPAAATAGARASPSAESTAAGADGGDDADGLETGSAGAPPAPPSTEAAEAALEEELAPARAAHRGCVHPFTVILFIVVCFVLPFLFARPNVRAAFALFAVCLIMAGSLAAICFRVWLLQPKAALFAAFPTAAAALIFFFLTAIGLHGGEKAIAHACAALAGAFFLLIAARVWAADRLEPTVALLKLTVAVNASNPGASLASALSLFVLVLWAAPFGYSSAMWNSYSFMSVVALYWISQTARYLVHASVAAITTSWYYTRAGADPSSPGLGVGITAPSLALTPAIGIGAGAGAGVGAGAEGWFGADGLGSGAGFDGDDDDDDDELDMDGTRSRSGSHRGGSGSGGVGRTSSGGSGLGTVVGLRGYAPMPASFSRSPSSTAAASDGTGSRSAAGAGSSLDGLGPTVSTARAFRRRLTFFATPRAQKRLAFITVVRAITLQFGAIAFGAFFVAPVRGLWLLARRLARVRCLSNRRVMRSALAAAELLHYHFNRSAFRHVIVYGTDFTTASHITYRAFRSRGVAAVVEADEVETFVALVPVTVGAFSAGLFYIYTYAGAGAFLTSVEAGALMVFLCAALLTSSIMEAIDAVTATIYACFAECPGVLREAAPVLFARFVRLAESAMVRDLGAGAGAGAASAVVPAAVARAQARAAAGADAAAARAAAAGVEGDSDDDVI